jgi:hypothetical protein
MISSVWEYFKSYRVKILFNNVDISVDSLIVWLLIALAGLSRVSLWTKCSNINNKSILGFSIFRGVIYYLGLCYLQASITEDMRQIIPKWLGILFKCLRDRIFLIISFANSIMSNQHWNIINNYQNNALLIILLYLTNLDYISNIYSIQDYWNQDKK